jgi:hypothetical protein
MFANSRINHGQLRERERERKRFNAKFHLRKKEEATLTHAPSKCNTQYSKV